MSIPVLIPRVSRVPARPFITSSVKTPPLNKPIVGKNAFLHESGIHQHGVLANKETYEILTPQSVGIVANNLVLGKHSGKHAFESRLQELGYHLSAEELLSCFEEFKVLCDKKKTINDEDIEAIVLHKTTTHDMPEDAGFKLDRFVVHTSNFTTSTITVVLTRDGEDVTDEYRRGAEFALKMAQDNDCSAAVLKERSPSCGSGKIYDGSFSGTLADGWGVTAELLLQNGISVYGESEIDRLFPRF